MIQTEVIENIEVLSDLHIQKLKSKLHSTLKSLINKSNQKIVRLEFPIPKINILNWLNQQISDQQIYWSERSGDYEVGGIGQADIVSDKNKSDYSEAIRYIYEFVTEKYDNLRYFGGLQFQNSETPDELWGSFSKFYFILPQFEIVNLAEDYFFLL